MTVPIMAEPIGTTRALQEVSVRARVRRFLEEVHFSEGGDVKAGQLLFVIGEVPFQAKAKLDEAEAARAKARNSKSREIATVELAFDQSSLALAEVEERRAQLLFRRNDSAIEDVQRKLAIRMKDSAQVEAARAGLEQAKADFEANILAAQADGEAAKALVRGAEIDLGYCRMHSPIDGRAGLVKVQPGNLVGPAAWGGGSDYTEQVNVRQLDPRAATSRSPPVSRPGGLAHRRGARGRGLPPRSGGGADAPIPRQGHGHRQHDRPTTSTFLLRAVAANPANT